MCGLMGYVGSDAAAKILHGLMFLQHRGQDATGVATVAGTQVFIEKGFGLVEEVFDAATISNLQGDCGIGHVRYTTSGDPHVLSAVQPFYVNQPYGMTLAHNGNLTNSKALLAELTSVARRHISSNSDSELLLNMFAHLLDEGTRGDAQPPSPKVLFRAIEQLHAKCQGAYSVVVSIAGVGLLAFRDPYGVRPLVFGKQADPASGRDNWLFASENVAFRSLGFTQWEDVNPGEAVFVDTQGQLHRHQHHPTPPSRPCIFEYIYLARPDSTLNNASVYEVRTQLGKKLAEQIQQNHANLKIDCVVPVPDSGRVTAMELAHVLNVPYREGLVKNRYIGRTFIEAGATNRIQSVRKKLNVIESEFCNKHVMLVDDSIVRGTTSKELVQLARAAGAKKVYFASAAPPVRFPNVYGIDIPTRSELIAGHRSNDEVAHFLDVDCLIYQALEDMVAAIGEVNPALQEFETSCFDGHYPIGEVDDAYLAALENERGAKNLSITQAELLLKNQGARA